MQADPAGRATLAPIDEPSPTHSRIYRHYVLTGLSLAYTLSLLDQGVVTLVLESIKQDLHVTDTQLGVLTGIAFGLFYATLALPVARWADRGNRVTITSIALALWGATVMLPMFVVNFTQLLLARMAAAVGASGCMPPSYSLVGDYYPAPVERTRAMAVYMLANPLSYLLSFGLGGWLSDAYGWRATFFAIGFPGLLVALLLKTTVVEPRTRFDDGAPAMPLHPPRLLDVLKTLWRQHSTRHILFALIIIYIIGLGTLPWYAAFMMRSHHMGTTEIGLWFGVILGLGGMIGAVLGGYIVGRWFPRDERAQMRFVAVTIASLVPCFASFLLLQDKLPSLVALTVLMIIWNLYVGPTFALLQRLVADEMRATTLAAVMLVCNLIGMGVGPQTVGILSDFLHPVVGADSLRYAILIVSSTALWGAFHFWRVGSFVRENLAATQPSAVLQA